MKTPSQKELDQLSYDELGHLGTELAEEDEEIKRVRHHFIEEFWKRIPQKSIQSQDLREGEMVGASLDGKPVLWAKVEGKVYALGNKCPHRGFPLSKGKLDGYTLTCAYHGGQFDIRTGGCIEHPTETFSCERFQVQTKEDGTIVCEAIKEKK
jgi:3-phenylpropionate/trans-cinnamate dioxygenase ferredoxin subunit